MQDPSTVREPHPLLDEYYAAPEDRKEFVRSLFDRTAEHYDPITKLSSLGTGHWYRKRTLRAAGIGPGADVLDVATGTGQVALPARELAGPEGRVTGLDLSIGMLREARKVLGAGLVQAEAGRLPIAAERFDFVTMGYALRHVGHLTDAFAEFHRVLRPGGKLIMLEIGRPATASVTRLVRWYLRRAVPWWSRLTTRSPDTEVLMRYYWDTIEACVAPAAILEAMRLSGFEDATCAVELGMFRAYSARTAPR